MAEEFTIEEVREALLELIADGLIEAVRLPNGEIGYRPVTPEASRG